MKSVCAVSAAPVVNLVEGEKKLLLHETNFPNSDKPASGEP